MALYDNICSTPRSSANTTTLMASMTRCDRVDISDYHHEAADTVGKLNVRELRNIGQVTRLLYRLSHQPPGVLPDNPVTGGGAAATGRRARHGCPGALNTLRSG